MAQYSHQHSTCLMLAIVCWGLRITQAKRTQAGWLLNTVSFSPPVDGWLFPECSCAFLIVPAGWRPWPGANKTRILYSSRIICISNELVRKNTHCVNGFSKMVKQRKLFNHIFFFFQPCFFFPFSPLISSYRKFKRCYTPLHGTNTVFLSKEPVLHYS